MKPNLFRFPWERASSSLLGVRRWFWRSVIQDRRSFAQPSFPRRPAPQIAVRVRTAGAGGEKTARPKRAFGSLTRGLASDLSPYPQPHGGRDMGTDHWRFAGGKPGIVRGRQLLGAIPPARETPAADRPPPWGIGRDAGATLRDAIQLPKLALESLRGREGLSFRRASRRTEFAIG